SDEARPNGGGIVATLWIGERRLPACMSRQLAETLSASPWTVPSDVAGKLPATAGRQPALPADEQIAPRFSRRFREAKHRALSRRRLTGRRRSAARWKQ